MGDVDASDVDASDVDASDVDASDVDARCTTPCASDADNCVFNRKLRNNDYCVHANTDNCDLIKSNIHNRALLEYMGVRLNKPIDMFGRCWFNGQCSECADNVEASDVEASDVDASDVEASDVDASDVDASDVEASDVDASDVD